jgi:ubiquinone/menaquinone biosynthesis C-methylase UbiE
MGAIIHDLAYEYVLVPGGVGAVKVGENLNKQREEFARNAQRSSYRRILELGSGTGRCTNALSTVFPDAELHGVELSAEGLRRTRALSVQRGAAWHLRQAPAEATGYPDDQFDLVAIYTLFHEVPTTATREILAETLRVLEPGGDVLIGDVAPYERQAGFQTVVMDWETENRGEPYWRDALMLDLPALLKELGYVDVEAFGMNGGTYPWITRARKPR